MLVRPYQERDWWAWLRMEQALLPPDDADADEREMRELLARDDAAVFIAERDDPQSRYQRGRCRQGKRPTRRGSHP